MKISNMAVIKDPTTLKTRRCTTLQNIYFRKLCQSNHKPFAFGGILNDKYGANFLQFLPVKFLKNLSRIFSL